MMEDNFEETGLVLPPKRPVLLTVLCILTFISTGFSILGCLVIPAAPDLIMLLVQQNKELTPQEIEQTSIVINAGWPYYLALLMLTLLSLSGAILMLRLKRNGFHFYTIANILLFFIPIVWLGMPFSLFAAFFPAMFVGLYAMHLKVMT